MKVKVSELRLGDQVRTFEDAYGSATVYSIDTEGNASVWRPYIHISNFACGDGAGGKSVIPYIGVEDFVLLANSTVELIGRNKDEIK